MTAIRLARAAGDIGDEFICAYDNYRPNRRRARLAVIWAAVLLCVCLISASLICLSMVFRDRLTARSDSLSYFCVRVGDRTAAYTDTYTDLFGVSVGEAFLVGSEGKISYLPRGSDTLEYLLIENEHGMYNLLRFECFTDEVDIIFGDNSANPEPHKAGDVLSLIYGIHSADDIDKIIIERLGDDDSTAGKAVRTKKMTLRGGDAELFYSAIVSQTVSGIWLDRFISADYANESKLPLTEQTSRRVTIKAKNGSSVELEYYAAEAFVRMMKCGQYRVGDADNAALIALFGIDMTYHEYETDAATTERFNDINGDQTASVPYVGETAVPRKVPEDTGEGSGADSADPADYGLIPAS